MLAITLNLIFLMQSLQYCWLKDSIPLSCLRKQTQPYGIFSYNKQFNNLGGCFCFSISRAVQVLSPSALEQLHYFLPIRSHFLPCIHPLICSVSAVCLCWTFHVDEITHSVAYSTYPDGCDVSAPGFLLFT